MSPKVFESFFLSLIILTTVCVTPAMCTSDEAIRCNNEGVRFLQDNKFEDAVRSFKKALEIDSSYELAQQNLSIAYNNLGMEKVKEKSHEDALLLFEQALFIHPSNPAVRTNVDGTLKMLGHNPSVAADRAALGDMFFRRGAVASALMEYEAALALGQQESLLVKERNAREKLLVVEPGLLQIHLKQISAMKLGGTKRSAVNMAALTLGSGSGGSVFDMASSSSLSASLDPRAKEQATSTSESTTSSSSSFSSTKPTSSELKPASTVSPIAASSQTTTTSKPEATYSPTAASSQTTTASKPASTVSPIAASSQTTTASKPEATVSPTAANSQMTTASKPEATVSPTTSNSQATSASKPAATGSETAVASSTSIASALLPAPTVPVSKDAQKSKAINEIDDSSASEFVALLSQRSYEKVIDKVTKSLSRHPSSARLYFYRARAYYHMKNLSKAVQDARQAVTNDRDYIDAYATIGDAEFLLGHNNEAIEAFSKAIALTPSKATFYYCRARAEESAGLKTQSQEDNAKAKSLGDSHHTVAGEPASIDFGPYMAATQKKIKAIWHPPKCDSSYKVKTRFKIRYDGQTSNIQVVGSGGEVDKDNVALRAVQEARLPALPAGSPPEVDMEFTFEYNVHQ